MKKLITIVAIAVSGFVNGQTIDAVSNQIVSDHLSWSQTTKSFKTGDDDGELVLGLLKTLFLDSTSRYEYILRSPNIGNLLINGYTFKPDSELQSFSSWIETLPILDTNEYELIYRINDRIVKDANGNPFRSATEELRVINKETGETVRYIGIVYTHNNFRVIRDSNVK